MMRAPLKRGALSSLRAAVGLGIARRGTGRGWFSSLPAPFHTLARVFVSFTLDAIPGGRGGPQSVAPILPVDCRAAQGRAARSFAGVV